MSTVAVANTDMQITDGGCDRQVTVTLCHVYHKYEANLWNFYRATACNATHGIAIAKSVHLSDACIINIIRNRDISSLSTPMGVAENCPLPPEIFAESDQPSSIVLCLDFSWAHARLLGLHLH